MSRARYNRLARCEKQGFYRKEAQMANVAHGKKILAIAVLACLVAALVSVPAFAFYYVHDDEHVSESTAKGAMEVCVTLDAKAIGEGVHTELIFVPDGSTAEACLSEDIVASNNQNGLEAIHSYGYSSLADYLADKDWTCTVHAAASQNPGTQTTYDTDGESGTDIQLNRYDSVVFTVNA